MLLPKLAIVNAQSSVDRHRDLENLSPSHALQLAAVRTPKLKITVYLADLRILVVLWSYLCASQNHQETMAAARKHEDECAAKFGQRIHCDLIGPIKANLKGEVYAFITHDEATGYPSVRPLRSLTAVETAAAWNDMYSGLNPPVLCCRTDNEGG